MQNDNKRVYIILAALIVVIIAIAAIIRLGPQAPVIASAEAARNTISAQGTGMISVKPDMATLSVGVTAQNASAKEAQAEVNRVAESMIQAARDAGIEDKDILTSGVSLYPTYDYSRNTSMINGYEARYTLSLKVYDMDKVGGILDQQIEAGANSNGSVTFGLDDDSETYKQALKSAVADAKEKAETLAAASGGKLGGVITITDAGGAYPYYRGDTALMSMATAAAAGETPIMAEAVNLTASVTVTYELR